MSAQWLDIKSAAVHSGFCDDTLGDALRSGELRGYQRKPGGKWRIAIEDLDAWIRGDVAPVEAPALSRRRR